MTLYKSEQTLHTYFMVADALTKNYFHRILLPFQFRIFFDAKLLNRCFTLPYKYYTKGLHSVVVKPIYTPGSSSPIEDRFVPEAL
jgi:hypothetical protein